MAAETRASIGQVKRDISELVNRVAYGGERVVLTSRGKAKAVLVGVAEYERLKRRESEEQGADWPAWLARSEELSRAIIERRGGEPLDVDGIWQAARAEAEGRDERLLGD